METRLENHARFRHWSRGAIILAALAYTPAAAMEPERLPAVRHSKPMHSVNRGEAERWRSRLATLDRARSHPLKARAAEASTPGKTGKDRLLVLLVEFGGPDSFDFVASGANASRWDPFGKADTSEWTGVEGDCSAIVRKNNLSGTRRFTYSGPLHGAIERPRSASDASGSMVWTEDFSRDYYERLIFSDGVKVDYARQDGSRVSYDLTGLSLRNYFRDASLGRYDVEGEVHGWIRVPHSVWWYGADPCPGRLSGSGSSEEGSIPGAGTPWTLVTDAIDGFKAATPGFDWSRYDQDGDGTIDHLVLIVAGLAETSSTTLLDRTTYGEAAIWPHSSRISPPYEVMPGIRAADYIVMAEGSGLSTIVHEYSHAIGAEDLYNIAGPGMPSPGMWSIMADSWTGSPETTAPAMLDPMHLDAWGWLDPLVLSDPGAPVEVTIGQTSEFPGGEGVYRGVKIVLPEANAVLPVRPKGTHQWWGGQRAYSNSRMTLAQPVAIPTEDKWKLRFEAAWRIEEAWDFAFVQASNDRGASWTTLTNSDMSCRVAPTWAGPGNGLPADLCAAGLGGFTGVSVGWPSYRIQEFDLSPFAGQEILVRIWYMTDIALNLDGIFVDNVAITDGANYLLGDAADEENSDWVFSGAWERNDGTMRHAHGYYLQWRNTGPTGGVDKTLGTAWRYGPANPGLLVWYYNARYTDNVIDSRMFDAPSFGPKGLLLLVDAHPEPYRSPDRVAAGFPNESANATDRSQMRDAAFSLLPTAPFRYTLFGSTIDFPSRPPVPVFSDAKGYYPGLERVALGPRETEASAWITAAWSASAVVPASTPYAVKAPGYRAGTPVLFNCSANATAGTLGCMSRGLNLSLASDGGTGDPAGGAYGWNVEVLSQTDRSAKVRIWNGSATPTRAEGSPTGRR